MRAEFAAAAVGEATMVDLRSHVDNTGITRAGDFGTGAFNVWSNTFPAEHVPPGGIVDSGGIPFRFPAGVDAADNLRCAGQRIAVPVARYDWIYLLAAAERRTEDPVYLHFADGATDQEWLRVPDFWPETPAHFGVGHGLAFPVMHYPRHVQRDMAPSIWRVRIGVPREAPLTAIHLPDNPAIHIFAVSALAATVFAATVFAGTEPGRALGGPGSGA